MKEYAIESNSDVYIAAFKAGLQFSNSHSSAPASIEDSKFSLGSTELNLLHSTASNSNSTKSRVKNVHFKIYAPDAFIRLRARFNSKSMGQFMRGSQSSRDSFDLSHSFCSVPQVLACGQLKNSGSRFYYSMDRRFILKTLPHSQVRFLLRHLDRYERHLMESQESFLIRIHGLYRVLVNGGAAVYLLAMENVLFHPVAHTELLPFDLKCAGLLMKRDIGDYRRWMSLKCKIPLPSTEIAVISDGLKADVEWLRQSNVNDYSILLALVPAHPDLVFVSFIDILSEWHWVRKLGFCVPGRLFPRFMRPTKYAQRMDVTIDSIFTTTINQD